MLLSLFLFYASLNLLVLKTYMCVDKACYKLIQHIKKKKKETKTTHQTTWVGESSVSRSTLDGASADVGMLLVLICLLTPCAIAVSVCVRVYDVAVSVPTCVHACVRVC